MIFISRSAAAGLAMVLLVCSAGAQTEESTLATSNLQSSVESLDALLKTIASKEADIAATRQKLQEAKDEVARNALLEELRTLNEQEAQLQDQFERFAVAVDTSEFSGEPLKIFNWQEELTALIRPILAEFKSATAETRAMGEIRSQIDALAKLHGTAEKGVENLERLLGAQPSPLLQASLQNQLAVWSQRRDDAYNQMRALQIQLDNKLAARKSVLDSTTHYAQVFFRTRGLNLFMGILAFVLVFFGVRYAYAAYRKVRLAGRRLTFATRLGALIFHFLSMAGGIMAMLLVFNMVGDWFLLGIVVILLLGVAWAGIKTLPQNIETIKLVLNVGAVKEQERILYDGLPWLVEALGFNARLVNPLLDGGVQILPVVALVGLHSRPSGKAETWFPCREGDWVELSDGRWGQVASQTPSAVRLLVEGGASVVYPTAAFLDMHPCLLSNGFVVRVIFGIDYKHQAQCTREIPDLMQARLARDLPALVGEGNLASVTVELKTAGPSSLDLVAKVMTKGGAAPYYRRLENVINRILVEACTEHGWDIPFPQVTVHRADAPDPGGVTREKGSVRKENGSAQGKGVAH